MHAVLDRMNLHGPASSLCGLISGYTTHDPNLISFGQLIIKRLRVEGFLIMDYIPKFMDAGQKLGMWKMTGKLKKPRNNRERSGKKPPKPSTCSSTADNTGKTHRRTLTTPSHNII